MQDEVQIKDKDQIKIEDHIKADDHVKAEDHVKDEDRVKDVTGLNNSISCQSPAIHIGMTVRISVSRHNRPFWTACSFSFSFKYILLLKLMWYKIFFSKPTLQNAQHNTSNKNTGRKLFMQKSVIHKTESCQMYEIYLKI